MSVRQVVGSLLFVAHFTLLAPICAAQAAGCELLAKDGIAETATTLSDNEVASSHRRWFCDKRFSSQAEAESYSINGLLPFEGLPVKLGFDANRDKWETWSREICSDEQSQSWSKSAFIQERRTLNVDLAKAISDCIVGRRGLFVWLERTSDTKFKLVARFDSPLPGVKRARLNFTVDRAAICEGQLKSFALNSPNEHRWLCRRRRNSAGQYATDAVQIAANSPDATPQWGGSLVLPEIFTPVIVPPKPTIVLTSLHDTYCHDGTNQPPCNASSLRFNGATLTVLPDDSAVLVFYVSAMQRFTMVGNDGPGVNIQLIGDNGANLTTFDSGVFRPACVANVTPCGGSERNSCTIPASAFPPGVLRSARQFDLKINAGITATKWAC